MTSSFLIIVYLIVLAAITGFSLVKAEISGLSRIALVAIAFFVASAYYFHVDSLRGYSTEDQMHDGKVAWIEIIQPNGDEVGGIYVWMYEYVKDRSWVDQIYGINSEYNSPRSFRLPYTKENQRKFETLRQKMKQGYAVESQAKKVSKKQAAGGTENGPEGAITYDFVIVDPRQNLKDVE